MYARTYYAHRTCQNIIVLFSQCACNTGGGGSGYGQQGMGGGGYGQQGMGGGGGYGQQGMGGGGGYGQQGMGGGGGWLWWR